MEYSAGGTDTESALKLGMEHLAEFNNDKDAAKIIMLMTDDDDNI